MLLLSIAQTISALLPCSSNNGFTAAFMCFHIIITLHNPPIGSILAPSDSHYHLYKAHPQFLRTALCNFTMSNRLIRIRNPWHQTAKSCIFFRTAKATYILGICSYRSCRYLSTSPYRQKPVYHLIIFCQFAQLFFYYLDSRFHLAYDLNHQFH